MDIKFLNIQKGSEDEFSDIAEILLNEVAISNHQSIFRIIEIEFYWYSASHKDESTYKRKYVDPDTGEWFFHYSGVDIALKDTNSGGFGGILIRGIYSLKEEKVFRGPMVCAMKLFSGTSAFSESIQTKIIAQKFDRSPIEKSPRVGLGKNAIKSKTDQLNYRFFITQYDRGLANK